MKYTMREAQEISTGNRLVIVECHNGLIFEGDNAWIALDKMLAYYGL